MFIPIWKDFFFLTTAEKRAYGLPTCVKEDEKHDDVEEDEEGSHSAQPGQIPEDISSHRRAYDCSKVWGCFGGLDGFVGKFVRVRF